MGRNRQGNSSGRTPGGIVPPTPPTKEVGEIILSRDESEIFATFDVPLYIRDESSTKIVVNIKGKNTDADYELSLANSIGNKDYYRDESQQIVTDWGIRSFQIQKDIKIWGLATWGLTEDAIGKTVSIKTIDQAGVQIYP